MFPGTDGGVWGMVQEEVGLDEEVKEEEQLPRKG